MHHSGVLFQVTSSSIRLVSCETKKLVCRWSHPDGKNISLASCNNTQVVCAVGSQVFYLEIGPAEIKQIRSDFNPAIFQMIHWCHDVEK